MHASRVARAAAPTAWSSPGNQAVAKREALGVRTRATRATSRTPAVAAPRHNPKGARRIPARNPNPSAYPAALTPTPYPYSSPRPQPHLQAVARASLVPHAFKGAWVRTHATRRRRPRRAFWRGPPAGTARPERLPRAGPPLSACLPAYAYTYTYLLPTPTPAYIPTPTPIAIGQRRRQQRSLAWPPCPLRRDQSAYPAGRPRRRAPACLPCPPTPALGAPPTPTSYLAGPHARHALVAPAPRPLAWSPCPQGAPRAPTPQAPPPRLNPNP
eukprot:scaffold45502_cov38-Phaeocystis_antarctica.AAC.1